jgi:hypothetical protein
MSRVQQTKEDLQKQLNSQLELLNALVDLYDQGKTVVAKSIASSIRVLLHETPASHSLLFQLGLEEVNFFDSCLVDGVPEGYEQVKRLGSYAGLFGIGVSETETTHIPYLDEIPGNNPRHASYDEYWNRIVFHDKNNGTFTRKDIVLAVVNKDGGAHVDPELDQKYVDLVKHNSLGWEGAANGQQHESPRGAESAAVRQIAHEILRTFLSDYSHKRMSYGNKKPMIIIAGSGPTIGTESKREETIIPRVGRNDKCPCGSGLKYKKCHGK